MKNESIKRLAEIDKELMILRKQITHHAKSDIYDNFRFIRIVTLSAHYYNLAEEKEELEVEV